MKAKPSRMSIVPMLLEAHLPVGFVQPRRRLRPIVGGDHGLFISSCHVGRRTLVLDHRINRMAFEHSWYDDARWLSRCTVARSLDFLLGASCGINKHVLSVSPGHLTAATHRAQKKPLA